jgi:hypothetical protein
MTQQQVAHMAASSRCKLFCYRRTGTWQLACMPYGMRHVKCICLPDSWADC